MKKRIISMLLVVAAVLSMIVVPVGAYDVTVDTTATAETCKCGCGQPLSQITWKPWDVNTIGDPSSGHFYLEGNYAQDEQITVISGESVVLDLRGYTLTTNGYHRLALVYGYMAVLDTVGGGRFCAKTSGGGNGGVVMVGINETPDPTFELWSGTVTVDADNKSALRGGLITVGEDCNFRMYGGMLLNGSTATNSNGDLQNGGAIAATATNSTIEILGGSIIGCSATGSGGSIYSLGTTILKNCQIIGGTSTGGFGGNIYQSGGKLIMENCTVRDGVSNRNTSTKNGGGNITVLNSGSATITGCTIANGYAAYNGGNLFLGRGTATLSGCKIYGGTAGLNGGNIACNSSSNTTTITDCTIAGDMEYTAGSLTLAGKTVIELNNTGLNITGSSVAVDASGLTDGAGIYLNADGVTLENANMDYFKPAIRTTLTQSGTSITANYAADGETAGYCPHCDAQVAWTPLTSSDTLAETSGHFYIAADMTRTSQLTVGKNDNSNAVDAVIDLNGCTVTCSGRFAYIYSKAGDTALSVMDSAGGGTVTGKGVTSTYFQNGGVIYNEKNLNIYGGKLAVNFDATRGLSNGGVISNGGVFNMYGGILDGSAYDQVTAVNLDGETVNCYGGALYMGTNSSRVFNMSAGRIIGGTAYCGGSTGDLGQDIYISKENKSLTVGSGVTGNILLGAPTALLGDPVYGNPISTVTCTDLDAEIYLEGDYDLPNLCVSGGALCVGAFAMEKSDGEVVWYATAADAVAAAEENEMVRVYADCTVETDKDLYLDVGGSTVTVTGTGKIYGMDSSGDDYAVPTGTIVWASADAVNTDPVTYAPNGNMYITVTDGSASTYHRLNQYIGAVSLRTSSAGIYYTGVWACDSVVKDMIDSYGVAVSLNGMPTAAFATEDNGNMWTVAEEELEVGVNSTSVLISGIMKSAEEGRTAALNDQYGKMDIYATTYVKMKDGTVYISDDSTTKDDDVAYSLYDAMALLDELIVNDPNNFRHYTNQIRQFRDTWADFGMADWTDFQKIVTPAKDDVIDVLMIGSSFCYYYVEELASLAAAAGLEMRVCNVYYSGCKLYQHYNWWVAGESNYQFYETTVQDDGTVSRVKTTPASLEWCLNQGEWDVISLQESSSQLRTSGGVQEHWENTQVYRDALFPYLQTQFPDAQILWHQTWSYQIGYDRSGYQMLTLEQQLADMQEMKDFSILLCEEYGIGRVPTGSAWMNVRQGTCGDAYDNLCARLAKENGVGDYYHDGDIGGGQYLNACVWFEVITGKDCREIDSYVPTYETDTLSDSVLGSVYVDAVEGGYALQKDFMDLIQECAHQAVADMQAETEE